MNSYQLISKLRKVRDDTYLTTSAQALYHELVAICNELKWKDIFFVRSNVICGNLDMSDNTLRKSRDYLADAGLLYYRSCKDKRIGCYYSFVQRISDDLASSSTSSAVSYSKIADDIEDHIADEDDDEGKFMDDIPESLSGSSAVSPANFADDKKASSATSFAKNEDDAEITPIKENIKTINEESLAHTHEPPPPPIEKKSRKKERDEKPLVYPFSSIGFMSAWEMLRQTPKWKNKLNLALQLSLNKLGKFEEEFAIRQIERAVESEWTGVVFTGTERDYQEWLKLKNGKSINEVSKPGANSSGRASQDKAASRQSLEDLADSILEQFAAEECA